MLTVTPQKKQQQHGKIRKRKEIAIPSRIKVFNSMQNYTYLHSNVYLSLEKSATVSFLANI